MREKSIKTALFCILILLISPSMNVKAMDSMYTYTYDYFGDAMKSPDAYTPSYFITGNTLGIGNFKDPQGVFVKDNTIYVCDTGNNRIVIIEKNADQFVVINEFSEFDGDTAVNSLAAPHDIFVSGNGDMYICDTNNQRIVQIDSQYRLVKEMHQPQDETIDPSLDFFPQKVVVDRLGRIFVLVKNYNKGVLVFDNKGEFTGYMGANTVKFNMIDYLWKQISTEIQRSQMVQFVPTEYNNIAIDKDGFVYATTSVFEEYDLISDQAKPIRKLNTMGKDILIKNGYFPPIGDVEWGDAGGVTGSSKLVDVTALDNDTYYALDRTRGRIFGYDNQGNLLYAFGGLGNKIGYLQYPVAIDHMGTDLLVLDTKNLGITIFTLTSYGELINDALEEYKKGNYDLSAEYWERVLMFNGNYDLAYIGIGRSLLRQKRYEEAMKYFKYKWDDNNYSKAYQLYRKEWIERNISWIFTIVVIAIAAPTISARVKKIKREVSEA
ncbi:MAG: hypothetical protein GX288_02505 [Clostridiales bacterium]|nr:hypothetical protein [Clostridiales bacterium]